MDNHIYLTVERLEAMLLTLREQVTELREKVEENEKDRRATELGVQLSEQGELWKTREGPNPRANNRP